MQQPLQAASETDGSLAGQLDKANLLVMAKAAYAHHMQALMESAPALMAEIEPHRDAFMRFLVDGPDTIARIHGVPEQQHAQVKQLFPQTWLRYHGNVVQELQPQQSKLTMRRLGKEKYRAFWIRMQAEIFLQFQRQGLQLEE